MILGLELDFDFSENVRLVLHKEEINLLSIR